MPALSVARSLALFISGGYKVHLAHPTLHTIQLLLIISPVQHHSSLALLIMAPTAVSLPVVSNFEPTVASIKGENSSKEDSNKLANRGTVFNHIKSNGYLMERDMKKEFPVVVKGEGNYLYLSDGRKILDATSGAAVSCLGHGNQRVIDAITRQLASGTPYLCSSYWSSTVAQELCKELVAGTNNLMSRAYLSGSG